MGLISGCRYLKVNLKAKMYICVNSTIQRCPNKIIKIFLIEDFSHLPPVSTTPVVNFELRISPQIFEKIRNGPNGILWGRGKLIDEKNQKRKISWQCPFKSPILWYVWIGTQRAAVASRRANNLATHSCLDLEKEFLLTCPISLQLCWQPVQGIRQVVLNAK